MRALTTDRRPQISSLMILSWFMIYNMIDILMKYKYGLIDLNKDVEYPS